MLAMKVYEILKWAGVLFLLALITTSCTVKRKATKTINSSTFNGASFTKITNSRELLSYLGVVLNYNTGGNGTLITNYDNLYPTLPQNGDSAYSSTMSRMFTNFVMQVCQASVNNEANFAIQNRVVFKYVDLATAPNLATGLVDREQKMYSYIHHIATRFYGSDIQDDEFEQVKNFYLTQRTLSSQDSAGARDLAALVCALVGSSPRALMKM